MLGPVKNLQAFERGEFVGAAAFEVANLLGREPKKLAVPFAEFRFQGRLISLPSQSSEHPWWPPDNLHNRTTLLRAI